MTTVSIRTTKAREQGNMSRDAPSLLLADDERDLTLMIKLVEAPDRQSLAEVLNRASHIRIA